MLIAERLTVIAPRPVRPRPIAGALGPRFTVCLAARKGLRNISLVRDERNLLYCDVRGDVSEAPAWLQLRAAASDKRSVTPSPQADLKSEIRNLKLVLSGGERFDRGFQPQPKRCGNA